MTTQRTKLEREAEHLTNLQSTPGALRDSMITRRLREIANELTALDAGEHFTQLENKPKIELNLSPKVLRR